MILAVDFLPLTHGASGGIVHALAGVFRAYAAEFPKNQLLLFVPDDLPLDVPPASSIERIVMPRKALRQAVSERLRRGDVDVLFRPFPDLTYYDFPLERQIIFIPDMQHAERPEFFAATELKLRRLAFGSLLSHVGAIGTNTHFSARTVREYAWTTCNDIFLLPPAISFPGGELSTPAAADMAKAIDQFSGYFFMPANPWPHKNHRRLFAAFAAARPRLPPGTGLVLTGAG
jgi:hypothetical protein